MSLFSYPFISDTPAWPTQSTFHNEIASHEFFKGTGVNLLFMAALTGFEPAFSTVTGCYVDHYTTGLLVGKIRFALIQPLVLVLQTSATLYLRRFPILIWCLT